MAAVSAAQEGDGSDAFAALIRREAPRLLAVAHSILDDAGAAVVATYGGDVRALVDDHLAQVQGPMGQSGGALPPVPHLLVDLTTGRTVWSETLPVGALVGYFAQGRPVVTQMHLDGQPGCDGRTRVEIVDLAAGTTVTTVLDTCGTGAASGWLSPRWPRGSACT